eukprot:scaffold6090_cov168-Amphora_coffeaeformis.AAC.2
MTVVNQEGLITSANTASSTAVVWQPHLDDTSNNTLVFFVERRSTTFRLEPIIRQICQAQVRPPIRPGEPSVTTVEVTHLYDCLGLLRALQYDVQQYNQSILSGTTTTSTDEEARYLSYRFQRQATAHGFKLMDGMHVEIPGLDELVSYLQERFADKIQWARTMMKEEALEYETLAEYYAPGQVFVDTGLLSGLAGAKFVTKCRSSYYRRGKTSSGSVASTFTASFECVVAVGYQRFAVVEATFTQSKFDGTRRINGVEFLQKATPDLLERLAARGRIYQDMCEKHTLVEYNVGAFYSNGGRPSRSGGRLVVDATEAWLHNVHPAKAPADGMAADAVLEGLQAMARFQRQPVENRDDVGALFLKVPLVESLLPCTWPVVCGFSLTSRTWGLAMVDLLSPVLFRDKVFEDLVLPAARKRLLRALITSHAHRTNVDVLPGKGEGLIFLLHGSPGTGKTLTAEAVAEVLRLPLYRVSMGELGTTPDQLEERLQKIFDLCSPWNAIVLIDEAEILLESRRQSSDLVRNAMVCVMLRLMEYFPGILFLTTNTGMDCLDPAIVSRLTCALHYEGLDENGRYQVFRAAVGRVKEVQVTDDDLAWLAKVSEGVNGRQIKNSVQLATALSLYEKESLKVDHLKETLAMTTNLTESGLKSEL